MFSLSAQSVAEQKVFGQYRQFRWTDVDGLPQNTVSSIAQSRDGYLWFATAEGLARFDGANFTIFGAKQLHQDWAVSETLLIDHAGALWISNRTGALTRYQDGVFTPFNATDKVGLSAQMIEDRSGNIWMPTTGSGLVRIRQGEPRIFTVRDGLPANLVTSVAEDGAGRLWVGTGGGLAFFDRGHIRAVGTRDGFPGGSVDALCVDRSGGLWIATDGRIVTFTRRGFQRYTGAPQIEIRSLFCDRNNRIWAGTTTGSIVLLNGGTSLQALVASGDQIIALFQDAEGAIWLGTGHSGLYQLRVLPIEVVGRESGIPGSVHAILQDKSGSMWLGGTKTFSRIENGVVTTTALPQPVYSGTIAEDTDGGVWLATKAAALLYRQGLVVRTVHPPFTHRITALFSDRDKNLWMGSDESGFCRWRDGQLTCFRDSDADTNFILAFHEDRSGAIWIATQNGVERFKDGVLRRWTTADGLASNQPAAFYETNAGSIWIGAENGGLSRYKDGKFSKVSIDNGLFDNVAFAILGDDHGNLWMSCNRGIYRAALRDLEDCADGRLKTLQSYSYDVADGMLSRECDGAFPAGWRSRDGKLWFGTVNGAVAIQPNMVSSDSMPRLQIEDVRVDGKAVAGSHVHLERNQEDLEIRYTALRCARPKQAHFKAMLQGLSKDWADMGLTRSVHYSHLPPGDYTFRVISDNGEGNWTLSSADLLVSIAAPYHKTWWFMSLWILAAGLVVAFAWRMRVGRLIHVREMQQRYLHRVIESQEQERKRLAGELHDGLAQRLTVMKNLALMNCRAATSAHDESTEMIATEAGEALREVREISYALRPYQLDVLGLKAALEALVERIASSGQTVFSCDLEGVEELVSTDAEVNVYRIVQESLQNIVKHAKAGHVKVVVSRNGSRAWLEITDDGVGFSPNENYSGLGLTSISERVQLLGGKFTIRSTPGKGTSLLIEFLRRNADNHWPNSGP